MQESSLHAALKNLYTGIDDRQEVAVEGYLIDVVCGDLLIEVQTGNFNAMKAKLAALLPKHPVRLVHPIALEKWIVRLPAGSDDPLSRRKSPKRGRREELFWELVRIPHLVGHPNLTLELVFTREEEIQREDGRGSWRRQGRSIADRRLLEVVERQQLNGPSDFLDFLPSDLPEPFTSRQLANSLRIRTNLAGKMIFCLKTMGLLTRTGQRGRAFLYALSPSGYNHES